MSEALLPVEKSCYWLATREGLGASLELTGNHSADFAVIGAGFTGLWTAHFLKELEPSADIVVVERSVAGYGASGRNAGIVSTTIDHSHSLAIAHFGKEEASRLAHIGLSNIDELEAFAQGCDFERSGQLQIALTEKHLLDLKDNLEVVRELGVKGYELLSREEARSQIDSPLYRGALFVPGGGNLNPIKLVDKIKDDILSSGARIFENTQVIGIDDNRVIARHAEISARKVILATDAYSHHLFPALLWRFIPLYDYILVSEPLDATKRSLIGWHNRQGVVDGRTFFNYYRLTSDDRVLWGTSEAVYYPPNKVDQTCDHSRHHYGSLKASFARHFPALADLDFPYYWGGPIASTTRLTPFFGTLNGGSVVYGLGYTGHGIGSTRLAGRILAHLASGRASDLLTLKMVTDKPFPYPPEPIRSLSVKAVTRSLQKVDAGENPNLLLKLLDKLGIGFSS